MVSGVAVDPTYCTTGVEADVIVSLTKPPVVPGAAGSHDVTFSSLPIYSSRRAQVLPYDEALCGHCACPECWQALGTGTIEEESDGMTALMHAASQGEIAPRLCRDGVQIAPRLC